MKIRVYRDDAGEWRWTMTANNGEIVADSSEGYINKGDCVEIATKVAAGQADIEIQA